jgi:hypothetical protein
MATDRTGRLESLSRNVRVSVIGCVTGTGIYGRERGPARVTGRRLLLDSKAARCIGTSLVQGRLSNQDTASESLDNNSNHMPAHACAMILALAFHLVG